MMASAMRQSEKYSPPTQVSSENTHRIGHEWPATRGRWNQGHLALLKSVGVPADFIFTRRLKPAVPAPPKKNPAKRPGQEELPVVPLG